MNRFDENAVITNARQGDLESFNQLVLAYQDVVYNQAYWILADRDAAEDAVQEAFISAFRNLQSFRGGSFRAWILRIVIHACYDELRRRKHRRLTPLYPVDEDEEEVESPYWMIDPSEPVEEMVERVDFGHTLQSWLDELPADFRAAVFLVDVQGLDYSEAADALAIPLGTLKSRLARARLYLRNRLNGAPGPPKAGAAA